MVKALEDDSMKAEIIVNWSAPSNIMEVGNIVLEFFALASLRQYRVVWAKNAPSRAPRWCSPYAGASPTAGPACYATDSVLF